jgi:hypothetical protein
VNIPPVNLQAIIAIGLFAAAALIARMTVNIYSGRWAAHPAMVFYLRLLLGFLLAGSVYLGYHSFAGNDVISGRWW